MRIIIEFIPHEEQRYETPGDYYIDENGDLVVKISLMGDKNSEIAVAIHEFVESYLCQQAGVTIAQVDQWDEEWGNRADKDDYAEPGDHPDAPYHHQHAIAMQLEKTFISLLDEDWDEHDKRVLSYSQ